MIKKKERKLEHLVSRLKMLQLPPHLYTMKCISVRIPPYLLCSLLHSHIMMIFFFPLPGADGLRTSLTLSLSRILLGEMSLNLISGDCFFLEKETCITVAKLSEKARCAEC